MFVVHAVLFENKQTQLEVATLLGKRDNSILGVALLNEDESVEVKKQLYDHITSSQQSTEMGKLFRQFMQEIKHEVHERMHGKA
jgi:hypothetical protein